MDKSEAIERLEYLKARAQIALEQEVPEWVAEDVLGSIEAYDMAIEALQIEPNCSEKPNNCETCKHWWRSEEVCLLDDCQYEPKDEPNADNSSSVAEVTTDCRQTKMTLDDAYYLVYKDLTKEDGLLTGKYDAKNGNKQYMNGVWSVMELIAYGVGIDCYEAFNERFCRNLEQSQERAKEPETERNE